MIIILIIHFLLLASIHLQSGGQVWRWGAPRCPGEYADKELGPLYKSYSSDNEFDTQVKQGTLKEGDFVYDAINGQFRVLTKEDVS